MLCFHITIVQENNVQTNVQARVYIRAKAKRVKAFKCVVNAKMQKNLFPRFR